MKKVTTGILFASLCAYAFPTFTKQAAPAADILPMAAAFDDLLIKINDIGHMYQLGTKINLILKGPYVLPATGMSYSIPELIGLEQKGSAPFGQMQTLLKEIKLIFFEASAQCLAAAHGSKAQFIPLIREWSRVRNKPLSPLLKWAEVDEQEEHEHFNRTITTFEKFQDFCLDLLTFLGDIINSCPKAHALFKQRMEKLHMIHTILPKVATASAQEEKQFVAYIMKNHLVDKVPTITTETVKELWNEFRKAH